MQIKMLNIDTINKIAAGEVIVRPVSVIKELVENSIDAGSKSISVEIENGGQKRMCITDDGVGIAYNEVTLAFKRHATSKLTAIEDLECIGTLGFRGEALSSIAAVAKVKITTRSTVEEIGSQAIFEGGKLVNQRVASYNKGTQIEVGDLFYNVPARKKHINKEKIERQLVHDLLSKLALSHPEIAFVFYADGKEIFRTTGSGALLDAIECLNGRDITKSLRKLEYNNNPMGLRGYIGDLTATKATKDEQIFYINNRYIKNKAIARAFEEAYEGYLMQHRHPVGIVFIELPGHMLDVNVHPAKTEVQILNESLVSMLFKQGIRKTLLEQNLVVSVSQVIKEDPLLKNESGEIEEEKEEVISFFDEPVFFSPKESKRKSLEIVTKKEESSFQKPLKASEKSLSDPLICSENIKKTKMANYANQLDNATNSIVVEEKPNYKIATKLGYDFIESKIIGQVFATYILIEKGTELWLIDQHAAHEAFLYAELKEKFYKKESVNSQLMMMPSVLDCSTKECEAFEGIENNLLSYGFDANLTGEKTVLVRSVPILLGEPQQPELLKAILENAIYAEKNIDDLIERITMMSCKMAIKGNSVLSVPEIRKLLSQIAGLENPFTCPHGRPIIVKMTEYELKKLFKRVV